MLNSILGLTPLTKVEIADKRALREARIQPSRGVIDQPYWFFMHVHADGKLAVSTPGGCRENIDATDVMNIIAPTVQIRAMAMPRPIFQDRSRRLQTGRRDPPGPECYHPGWVIAAYRDRWGRFDYNVWFDNPDFNVSSTYAAPLMDGEHGRLKPLTTRRNMPVSTRYSPANWSADSAALAIEAAHAKKAKLLVRAALQGDVRTTSRLASLDARLSK